MKILLWLQVQVLHTKKYKDAFDSIIQCLEERFYQNTARKKKGFFGKEDFFSMEMSWEKTFSMILQIFQFPKTSLNFTLFRNVLFPLNEKYSGLYLNTPLSDKRGE